jgi:hypothetical protein
MTTYLWWDITFSDNTTGHMKMLEGTCQNLYKADGAVITADEKVEYTCTNENGSAPSWYNVDTNTP